MIVLSTPPPPEVMSEATDVPTDPAPDVTTVARDVATEPTADVTSDRMVLNSCAYVAEEQARTPVRRYEVRISTASWLCGL